MGYHVPRSLEEVRLKEAFLARLAVLYFLYAGLHPITNVEKTDVLGHVTNTLGPRMI